MPAPHQPHRAQLFFYKDGADAARWQKAFAPYADWLTLLLHPNWANLPAQAAPLPSHTQTKRYGLVWAPPADFLAQLEAQTGSAHLEALFSLGAGLDHLTGCTGLEGMAIVPLSDPELADDMARYILMAALMLHRRMPEFIAQQAARTFTQHGYKAASETTVGILGYGRLGRAAAAMLKAAGLTVQSWSQSPQPDAGHPHFVGDSGFADFASACDIAVALLPLTPETTVYLNAERLKAFKPGCALINAGRGQTVCETSLMAALASGHISACVLDVFAAEPLPDSHPLWGQANVIVTPHVAALTRPETTARSIAEQIRAHLSGTPIMGATSLQRGY